MTVVHKISRNDQKLLMEAKARKEKERQRYLQNKQAQFDAGLCILEKFIPTAAKDDAVDLVEKYVRCLENGELPDFTLLPLAEGDVRFWRADASSDIFVLGEAQTPQNEKAPVASRRTPYKVRRAQQSKRARARKVKLGLVKVKFTIPIHVRSEVSACIDAFVRALSEGQLMSLGEADKDCPTGSGEETPSVAVLNNVGQAGRGKLCDLVDDLTDPQSSQDNDTAPLLDEIKSIDRLLK